MTSTINASTTAGLVQTADTSGVLALQTAGTTAVSISASQVVTLTNALAEASGGTGTTVGYNGFKNRIINPAMVIDQRNAGASVTPINGQYTVDRFKYYSSQSSKVSVQQNAGAVTPPAGFKNYLGVTSLSAYSVLSSDYFAVAHLIEGFNMADLGYGAAGASTVTLSFWVRSSLTGTFGGSLTNDAANYAYPFTYSISAANTWEQKSITITGATAGTWLTTTSTGIQVILSLGAGSTYSGTAGAWVAAGFLPSATGATSVVGTNGATFYITGVQLEKGSTATSFDYRPYGTELALCQRYFEIIGSTANSVLFQTYAAASSSGSQRSTLYYKVSKRTAPTATIVGTWSYSNAANLTVVVAGIDASRVEWDASGAGICFAYNQNTGAYLSFASEL